MIKKAKQALVISTKSQSLLQVGFGFQTFNAQPQKKKR